MADLTVEGIRESVRDYFDLDVEDLPDRMIDRWISEGWGKIVRYRPNWPGYEAEATIEVDPGAGAAEYDNPMKDIVSVTSPNRQLVRMSHEQAIHRFRRDGVEDPPGTSNVYSVYAGKLRFWPQPGAVGSYVVHGYRAPVNPIGMPTSDPIDLPHPDAGEILLAWVIYRAATREAEAETAAEYKDTFSQGLQLLAKDEVDSPGFTPIVLNSQPAYGGTLQEYLPDRLRMEGIDF